MKNKLLISGVAAALILGGAVAANASKKDIPEETIVNEGQMITAQEAEKIALTKAEGHVESVEFKNYHRFGKPYFEVDIENGQKEYHIHIDAYSGKVLKLKEEWDKEADWDDNFSDEVISNKQNIISSKKAIEIAEKAVNGKVIEMDKDEDDGRLIYEFELKTNKGKVDLDLDAVTGNVLNVEYDD